MPLPQMTNEAAKNLHYGDVAATTSFLGEKMTLALDLPRHEIADFCRRYAIRKLALFGSVLRNDFRPESDVDVLVEFEPDAHVGWEIVDMESELEQIFDREVDLLTPLSLNQQFREKILQTAPVIYERT